MIAYYAHEHGSGHSNCAQLFARCNPEQVLVFTSYPFQFSRDTQVVMLPSENPDGTGVLRGNYNLPDYLHYSPVGQESIQQRSMLLLKKCFEKQVKLLVVDVSAEIAALARAASLPYAFVRLPGQRIDAAHTQAFQGAVFLLAYYPADLEPRNTPLWIREKTVYLGFFSRFSGVKNLVRPEQIKKVLILSGRGGNERLNFVVPQIIERFRTAFINVFGNVDSCTKASNVKFHGFDSENQEFIERADVVVSNCGLNTIAELLHLKKTVIAVPEERPYKEQEEFYGELVKHKLVCPLNFALKQNDQEILNSVNDPEVYLGKERLKNFISALTQTDKVWDINIKTCTNELFANSPGL